MRVDVLFVAGFGQGDEVAGKLQSHLQLFDVGEYVAGVYRGYFQYFGVEIVFLADAFDDVVFFFGTGGVVPGQNYQGLQEGGQLFPGGSFIQHTKQFLSCMTKVVNFISEFYLFYDFYTIYLVDKDK